MKLLTISLAAFIAIAGTTPAMAETDKTRAQVKAELAQAMRTGDMPGLGYSALRPKEIHPHQYPATAKVPSKTLEQIKAKLRDAIGTSDMRAEGRLELEAQ